MTVLVVALTVAVALLGVLVVGLLRSHAEILRQLHTLGAGREDVPPARPVEGDPFDVHEGVVQPAGVVGSAAHDLAGRTLADETALVAVVGTQHDTLIAFLSSGCLTCQSFWEVFASPTGVGLPDGTRLVVVTKGTDMESESAVRSLAAPGVPLVMSTEAWDAYGVPGSPYFVLVDGRAGRVAGEGSATAWEQVVRLVREATGDRAAAIRRHHAGSDGHHDDRGDGAHREARADRELEVAGIRPGHASLYVTADELSDDRPAGA